MVTKNDLVVPVFKNHPIENLAKSEAAGRPIFDDMEVVEIRFAGDRQKVSVFPAHDYTQSESLADGTSRQITYAERWPEQYRRFKAKEMQVMEGTPIQELPFLTEARRSELRALNIYTAESLAALDGNALKQLGQGGRDLKNKAQAYIDAAGDTSLPIRQAAEIEALRAELAAIKKAQPNVAPEITDDAGFEDWEDADLKAFIKEETGAAPRGNPGHETLVAMAREAHAAKEGKAA